MSLSNLPSDIFSDVEPIKESPIEEFRLLKKAIITDPNNIQNWDRLLTTFDSKLDYQSLNKEFKSLVTQTYSELLTRFPYLVKYWKKWSVAEYKINGEKDSFEVVSRSVNNCQYSIDLWVDYLSGLELQNVPEKYGEMIELCMELNGYHFNSNKLWDKYITFLKTNNKDVLGTYLKLIRIPLYEYSKYFTEYMEISKSYSLDDIIPQDEQAPYLKSYAKLKTELSAEEQNSIIDEYSYSIFEQTKAQVTAKWKWESIITNTDLDLTQIHSEQDIWLEYLDYEISTNVHPQIINVFERLLIPNCFNETLWLKFLEYLNQCQIPNKFQIIDSLYSRCINKFLPLDQNKIRFQYPEFLLQFGKQDLVSDYLFDLIQYFSGQNYLHKYLKSQFLDAIYNLLVNWNKIYKNFIELLRLIIDNFFDATVKITTSIIESQYQNTFLKYINDQSIPTITYFYLTHIDDVDNLRSFFNTYHTKSQYKASATFWRFFIDLEIRHLNFINLHSIITYMVQHTQLPKLIIDKFLKDYLEVCRDNYRLYKLQCPNHNIIDIYTLFSTSVIENPGLLARYNKSLSSWKTNYDNPGLDIDKPDIINRLSMGDFSLLNNRLPELPIFKNVDKAGNPINYPKP